MAPSEIIELQKKTPFTGLRIVLMDGQSYDVHHPECMSVSRRVVHLAIYPGPDGVPEKNVYLDPMHVVRVEPLPATNGDKSRKSNGRKNKD